MTHKANANDFESRLAAAPLTPPAIDRDQLMYRAGWEAALASRSRTAARWVWPTGTAAAAAASLLIGMLLAQPQPKLTAPRREALTAAAPYQEPTKLTAPRTEALPDAPQQSPSPPWLLAWLSPAPVEIDPADTRLLALRERLVRGGIGAVWPTESTSLDDAPLGDSPPGNWPRRGATAGEMMEALLAENGIRS